MVMDSPKSEFVHLDMWRFCKMDFFQACLKNIRACPFSRATGPGLSMKNVFLEPCSD